MQKLQAHVNTAPDDPVIHQLEHARHAGWRFPGSAAVAFVQLERVNSGGLANRAR